MADEKPTATPKPTPLAEPKKDEIELNDEDMEKVSGGLNPQPLLPDRIPKD